LAEKWDKVIFGERFEMYQYFDMWQVIDEALKLVISSLTFIFFFFC